MSLLPHTHQYSAELKATNATAILIPSNNLYFMLASLRLYEKKLRKSTKLVKPWQKIIENQRKNEENDLFDSGILL